MFINLGEDGGFRGGERHVETTFNELEAPGLHFFYDDGCLAFHAAFGGDIEGEEGSASVDGPCEAAVLLALVEAEEQQLGNGNGGIELRYEFFFGYGVRVISNKGLDIFVGGVCQSPWVMTQGREVIE